MRNLLTRRGIPNSELRLGFLMILVLTLFGTATAQCPAQQPAARDLLDRSITLIFSGTVTSALNSLSNLAQVPIGFVGVSGENTNPRSIDLRVVQGTVRDVLNQIVRADDRYKWEQVNVCINVVPANVQRADFSELVITSLILNEVHLSDVGPAILDSPDIRARLETLGKKKTTEFKYIGPAFPDSKISIVFSNTTIRCALNEILNRKQARFWSLETLGAENEWVRIILFD